MKTKIILLGGALVVIAVSTVASLRALRTARLLETERASLLAAHVANDAEIRRLEERLETAAQHRTKLETDIAAARTTAKSTTPPASVATGTRNADELITRDPELQAMSISAQRAKIATSYGPFFVARALTNEQMQKFAEAKVRWFEQSQDLDAVMLEQNLPAHDPVVQSLKKRADDELQTALSGALGEQASGELKNYERTLPVRAIAERFAGAAALGDVPLTLQQAEQLTQIMAGAAAVSGDGDSIDPRTIDWTAVDTTAPSVLSPQQLELFQRIEPMGGGTSRWLAQLNQAIQEATRPKSPGS